MKDKIFDSKSQVLNVFGQSHSEKEFSINTENSGVIIRSLTKNLYNSPLEGTFRELISNAVDSVRKSGNKTIQIHIPTRRISLSDSGNSVVRNYMDRLNAIYEKLTGNEVEEDQFTDSYSFDPLTTLIIRDFGTGIDPEIFESLYTSLFTSTKRDDSDSIGYFGLGSKSPFSMSDSFDAINFWNGKKYYYNITLLEDSAKMVLLSVTDTIEPNGLMVCVPLNPIDSYPTLVGKVLSGFSDITFEITTNSPDSDDIVKGLLDTIKYNHVPTEEEISCLSSKITYDTYGSNYFYLGNVTYDKFQASIIIVNDEGVERKVGFASLQSTMLNNLNFSCPFKEIFYTSFWNVLDDYLNINISLDSLLNKYDVHKVVLPPSRDSVSIYLKNVDESTFCMDIMDNAFNQIKSIVDDIWDGMMSGNYINFYENIKSKYPYLKDIDRFIENDINFLEYLSKVGRTPIATVIGGYDLMKPYMDSLLRAIDDMSDFALDDYRYLYHNNNLDVVSTLDKVIDLTEVTKPLVENNFEFVFDDKFNFLLGLLSDVHYTNVDGLLTKVSDGEVLKIDSCNRANSFARDFWNEIKDLDLIPVSKITKDAVDYGNYESILVDDCILYPSNLITKNKITATPILELVKNLPLDNIVDQIKQDSTKYPQIRNFTNVSFRIANDSLNSLNIDRRIARLLALHMNIKTHLEFNDLRAKPIGEIIKRAKDQDSSSTKKVRSSIPNPIVLERISTSFFSDVSFEFEKRLHLDPDDIDIDNFIVLDENHSNLFEHLEAGSAYSMFIPSNYNIYRTKNVRDSNRIYKISVNGESLLDISNRNLEKLSKIAYYNIKSFVTDLFSTPVKVRETLRFSVGIALDTLIINNLIKTDAFLSVTRNNNFLRGCYLGRYNSHGSNIYLNHSEGNIIPVIGDFFINKDIEDRNLRRLADIMESSNIGNDYQTNLMREHILNKTKDIDCLNDIFRISRDFIQWYFPPPHKSKGIPTRARYANFTDTVFSLIYVLLDNAKLLDEGITKHSLEISDSNIDFLLGDNFPLTGECVYEHMRNLREDILAKIDNEVLDNLEYDPVLIKAYIRQILKAFKHTKEIELNE